MFGILLIDKGIGATSHDVVDAVRKKFSTRRVGHAGTLDPLATGLLVVAVGPATRFLQYLPLEPKEYVADIEFGRATSTYDREGETTGEHPVPANLKAAVDGAKQKFLGLISQLPPMYSAVKIDGKPLYTYARKGIDVEREPRTVHIEEFETTQLSATLVRAKIVCSGGTYIRSLAHDLGAEMGCGAFLSMLHRTRVGKFAIEEAVSLDACSPARILPLKEALKPMPQIGLNSTQVLHIREGRAIEHGDGIAGPLAALLDENGAVFSIARRSGHVWQPECVIPSEAFHGVS